MCSEVFGPVCTISKVSSFKEAVEQVNDSEYGLQAGVFTRDIHNAWYAFEHIDTGGVVINDIPTARVDSMPVRRGPKLSRTTPFSNTHSILVAVTCSMAESRQAALVARESATRSTSSASSRPCC